MKQKKVYRVTVSKEIWILADSDSEAEHEARFCADDDPAAWKAFAVEVKSANAIPEGIKQSNIWGSEDDVTVVEAVEQLSTYNAVD